MTASTVTMMRMLGLRFCNGDERRGGGVLELETVVMVSDPMTFSDKGGGEAIVIMRERERERERLKLESE